MSLTRLVDGVVIQLSPEEEAAIIAEWESNPIVVPVEPTKAELLAQIQALTAKVEALP